MTTDFDTRCRALEAVALAQGVCPKVCMENGGYRALHACGKPLAAGSQYCERHRYGV